MVFLADDGELIGLGLDYAGYIKQLNPALWFRLNELAGATALNSGSLGHTYDGTYTACTLAQPGKMSLTGAVLFDGATSKITVPAGAYAQDAIWTIATLINPTSTGEGGFGRHWSWGASTDKYILNPSSLTTLQVQRNASTPGNTVTTSSITNGAWVWVFSTAEADGKLHLYKGSVGVVTQFSYSAQVVIQPPLVDFSAVPHVIGNQADQTRTFNGLYDEYLRWPRALSLTEMLQIIKLSGV